MNELFSIVERLAFRLPGEFLSRHAVQLRRMFSAFRGNARVLVLTNICWMLPVTFSTVYLPIFMAEQGLSKTQIGTLGSVSFIFQVAGALFGGRVAERLGWKRTLMTFDGVLWPAVFLCFISAHGYLPFLFAAVLMGGMSIVMPAWMSIFIAGVPKAQRPFIFIFNQIPPLVAGMIAPVYGFLISEWGGGVSEVARWVYSAGCVLVLAGWWMRVRWLADPSQTEREKPGRSGAGLAGILQRHRQSAIGIFRRRGMLVFLVVQVLTWASLSICNTYMNLYLVDPAGKHLDKSMLSILPVFNGGITILTTLLIVPFITTAGLFGFILLGCGLMSVYVILVLAAAPGSLAVVVVGSMAWACGWSLYWPSLMAHWSNMMSDRERPHMTALSSAVVMMSISPVPTIAGAFFDLNPRNPLLMLLVILGAAIVLVAWTAVSGPGPGDSLTGRRRFG